MINEMKREIKRELIAIKKSVERKTLMISIEKDVNIVYVAIRIAEKVLASRRSRECEHYSAEITTDTTQYNRKYARQIRSIHISLSSGD